MSMLSLSCRTVVITEYAWRGSHPYRLSDKAIKDERALGDLSGTPTVKRQPRNKISQGIKTAREVYSEAQDCLEMVFIITSVRPEMKSRGLAPTTTP